MKKNLLKIFSGVLFAALALSGCISTPAWPPILGGSGEKPERTSGVTGTVTEPEPQKKVYPHKQVPAEVKPVGEGDLEIKKPQLIESVDQYQRQGRYSDSPLPADQSPAVAGPTDFLGPENRKFIAARLERYEQKIKIWNELAGQIISLDLGESWPAGWHECVQDLEMVLVGYRRLHDLRTGREGDIAVTMAGRPWEILGKDIHYAESGCEALMAENRELVSETVAGFFTKSAAQAADLVRQYLVNGQDRQAIKAYQNLKNLHADRSLPLEIKKMYSLALRRTGRLDEAALVLAEIIREYDGDDRACRVIKEIEIEYADLLLANGAIEQALRVYAGLEEFFLSLEEKNDWVLRHKRLLDEQQGATGNIDFYRGLLQAFYSWDGKRVPEELLKGVEYDYNLGEGLLVSSAATLLRRAQSKAAEWAETRLLEIDELIHYQEFDKAESLMKELLAGAPDDLAARLAQVEAQLEETRQQARQVRFQLKEQQEVSQWQQAIELFERRDYDAAIIVFTGLLQGDYGPRAAEKLAEAANLAAAEMRRQAASLFVKARKIEDPEQKKEILMQSRERLLGLLAKYPQIDLLDKVKQNLQVLEEQIKKIDPDLLLESSD